MDLEPAPSHASLGLIAGGSFVALALAAFASGYLLVLGSRVSAAEVRPSSEPAATGDKSDAKSQAGRPAVVRNSARHTKAIVRNAARKSGKRVESLAPGHRVRVAERKGKWLQISYKSESGKERQGWTHEVNLTFL